MTEKQQEILMLLGKHHITKSQIADILGLSKKSGKQVIGYQINKAKEIKLEFYIGIKHYISQIEKIQPASVTELQNRDHLGRENLTEEKLQLLKDLEGMGINSPQDLDRFFENISNKISDDLKDIIKRRFLKK